MIELQYEFRHKDNLAFQDYMRRHSKTIRNNMLKAWLIMPLAFLVLALVFWLDSTDHSFLAIYFLAAAILWSIAFPWFDRWQFRRNVSNILSEREKNNSEKAILQAEEDGIFVKTDTTETKYKWAAIKRIEREKDYLFIFISQVSAIVIPFETISDGDVDKLAEVLQTKIAKPAQ